jgi:hypothetical protein
LKVLVITHKYFLKKVLGYTLNNAESVEFFIKL